jgi:hypothetical protein
MKLPFVDYWREDAEIHATFALSLCAIGPDDALISLPGTSQLKATSQNSHQRNVRLMNLVARWPHPISFELHIVSKPSLLPEIPGRNEITLIWHVRAGDPSTAIELALSDSLRIDPLLKVFWPSSEWTFLVEGQIQERVRPFKPQTSLVVNHRVELISPSRPFIVDKPSIGFQAAQRQEVQTPTDSELQHVYPWVPSFGEDLSSLMDSLLSLPSPRWVVIRVANDPDGIARKRAMKRLEDGVRVCEQFLAGMASEQLLSSNQAQAIRDSNLNRYAQLSDSSLRGAVIVFAPGEPDFVTAGLLGHSVTGDHARRQINGLLEGGFSVRQIDPQLCAQSFQFPEGEPWSAEEAAGAFRLPLIDNRSDLGLPVQRHRTIELQSMLNPIASSCITLGLNVHRGVTRAVQIDVKERLHHALCIGATGVGKSSMLLSNMLQDAQAGIGFTLIDPPGELADDLLARLPKDRADDLIIIDLEDRDRPVPLNLLAWSTPEERDLIIDTLFTTLLSIYKSMDFFGPVFEQYFRSGLRLLLGDRPSPNAQFTPTLLEFPQVLRNRAFRNYLKGILGDEEVIDAIEEGERAYSGEATLANMAPYINSKFNRFLQDTQLRRIVGYGTMALNFREVMDAGKIIVFKLAQGRFGKNAADILLAQIVARFRLAAMSRADVPATQRKPYFLYIDECQVLADENIAEMLSQCRKYSLGLVLANQYVSQLKSRGVLDAILGNVGTIAAFRMSAEDARLLEPAFLPSIGAQDLVECPNWSGYMRLHSSRKPLRPFSFTTLPPDTTRSNPEWARELRENSSLRWGVSSGEIDVQINARRQFIRELTTNPKHKDNN